MPDLTVIIPHILNIIILYLIVRHLLYKPVKKYMDDRTARIAGELDQARQMQQEARAVTDKAQGILDEAREQSRSAINQAAQKAKEDAEGIIAMAEEKAREIVAQARLDAQAEQAAYKRELQNQVGDLALMMAGRILKREIRPEDNGAIIEDFFNHPELFSRQNGGQGV